MVFKSRLLSLQALQELRLQVPFQILVKNPSEYNQESIQQSPFYSNSSLDTSLRFSLNVKPRLDPLIRWVLLLGHQLTLALPPRWSSRRCTIWSREATSWVGSLPSACWWESSSSCCWLCCSGRWVEIVGPGSLHPDSQLSCLAGIELLESGFMLELPSWSKVPSRQWMESWLLMRSFTPEDWTTSEGTPEFTLFFLGLPSRVATSPTWWVTAGTGMWMVSLFTCHKHKKRSYRATLCSSPMWNMGKISTQRTLVMEIGYVSRVLPKCLHKKFSQPPGGPFVGGRLSLPPSTGSTCSSFTSCLLSLSQERGVFSPSSLG